MLHREVDAAGGDHKCNVFKEGEETEIEARKLELKTKTERDDAKRFAHFYGRYAVGSGRFWAGCKLDTLGGSRLPSASG